MTTQNLLRLHGRGILASLMFSSIAVSASAQGADAHHSDYALALSTVVHGEERIAAAMQQVQSGQVAHYDFLQQEHIDLIRHARALAWPPASIAPATKTALRDEAQALLGSAEALEWIIADYLRAVAQVRIATSNTLDIAEQAAQGAESELKASLEALQIETLMFMAAAYHEGWERLVTAYDTVLKSDISEHSRVELRAQKERLRLFTPQLQEHRQALLESDVDVQAARLKGLYEAAI